MIHQPFHSMKQDFLTQDEIDLRWCNFGLRFVGLVSEERIPDADVQYVEIYRRIEEDGFDYIITLRRWDLGDLIHLFLQGRESLLNATPTKTRPIRHFPAAPIGVWVDKKGR